MHSSNYFTTKYFIICINLLLPSDLDVNFLLDLMKIKYDESLLVI